MNNQATYCSDCGIFISAEPIGFSGQCDDRHEDELIRAVEENEWPDGISFTDWTDIKIKYSEPEHAFRE